MARRQFTITVSEELGSYLEQRSAQTGLNKSAVVSRALEAERERLLQSLMEQGYREMANHDAELAREFSELDKDSPWPEY